MGAAPPPYSYRDQQRQAKEYWRAQRQAARLHQRYTTGLRRSSITGPVVLIFIGVIALLIETGRISGYVFWSWYQRWWPLLLIGIGVVSLLEWLLDRNSPVPVRRSLGGLIVLLIFLSLVGWGGAMSHRWGGNFPDHYYDWSQGDFSVFGKAYENDADTTQSIAAGASIEVQNPTGDVTIAASADDRIHVHTHQVVHSDSQDGANGKFHDLDPKLIVSGATVLVRVDSNHAGRADLTIEVPKSSATDITAGHGDVTLEGLDGTANVTAKHGDVKFDGMGGSVTAHIGEARYTNRGDLSAHAVAGDVTVDGGLNDVTISEVKGKVLLNGEYFGDTHLEQVSGGVHFHSSRTEMEMGALDGDLTMDSSDLHMAQVAGPLRIVTRSKGVDVAQVSGDVHIESTDGEVNVQPAAPLGNIQINSKNQPITLSMPPGANFTVNGSTRSGDLSTDYNLNVSGSDNSHSVSGQVGEGGVRVLLDADHGDITLRKGDSAAPPATMHVPAPPEPPPAAPGGKVKHFKSARTAAEDQDVE
ncbi:MAG TPA: DUF4097 family beta strand repeat-containing protein [Acidisarcina sp.]